MYESRPLTALEHSNAIEIHDGIIFDFYTGLPHIQHHHILYTKLELLSWLYNMHSMWQYMQY